jgi:hypothetical protein
MRCPFKGRGVPKRIFLRQGLCQLARSRLQRLSTLKARSSLIRTMAATPWVVVFFDTTHRQRGRLDMPLLFNQGE